MDEETVRRINLHFIDLFSVMQVSKWFRQLEAARQDIMNAQQKFVATSLQVERLLKLHLHLIFPPPPESPESAVHPSLHTRSPTPPPVSLPPPPRRRVQANLENPSFSTPECMTRRASHSCLTGKSLFLPAKVSL